MSSANISLRVATVGDADAIARLTVQLGYPLPADSGARLERILARQGERFVVAEQDGRVVGWLHAMVADFIDVDPFVWIVGLVVDRDSRRQGIGQRLLAWAESWAAANGCPLVRLTSSSTREKAHRFYEGAGYINVKTQYSFAKPIGGGGQAALEKLVPRVDS